MKTETIYVWRILLVLVFSSVSGLNQAKADSSGPVAPLRSYADQRGFYIGAATSYAEYMSSAPGPGPSVAQIVAREFNMMAPQVEMEFAEIEPAPPTFVNGQLVPSADPAADFYFVEADAMVAAAVANHQVVRGASLLNYHEQPPWLTGCGVGEYYPNCVVPWTPDELRQIMQYHIQTVVSHFTAKFPGTVIAWLVVNEPEYDNTNPTGTTHRLSVFDTIPDATGKPGGYLNYYKLAFQYAHQADPDVLLGINDDHDDDLDGYRVQGLFSVVRYLLDAGAPISFVGFEMHKQLPSWQGSYSMSTQEVIMQTMKRYADVGIKVMVTEADVAVPLVSQADIASGLSLLPATSNPYFWPFKANAYGDSLNACVLSPNCIGFLTWGVNPGFSYLSSKTAIGIAEYDLPLGFSSDALPFDINNSAKPAYTAMQNALLNAQALTETTMAKNMVSVPIDSGTVIASPSSVYYGDYEIYSNGEASTVVNEGVAGLYDLHIRAAGTYAGGAWPNLQMIVDGRLTGNFTISSALINDYYGSQVYLTAGAHTVGFAFTNDFYGGPTQDRNVYLDRLWIQPSRPFSHYTPGASFADAYGMTTADPSSAAITTLTPGSAIDTLITVPTGGSYQVTLSAYAEGSATTAPYAQVAIDGELVGNFKITNSGPPVEYPSLVNLTVGPHTLMVIEPLSGNTNNGGGGQDYPENNLYVHHLMVMYQPNQAISVRGLAMNSSPVLPLVYSGEPGDVLDSPDASLQTVVNVSSGGTYNVTLVAASRKVTAPLSGSQWGVGWIYVDGNSIGSFISGSDMWITTPPLPVYLVPGAHTIDIVIANQETAPPNTFLDDRNLAVQSVTLTPK